MSATGTPIADGEAEWSPTLDNQVQGVDEQILFLQLYTFPAQVAARKMTRARADQKLEVLRAAVTTLRRVRDAEAQKAQVPLMERLDQAKWALDRVLGASARGVEKRQALLEIAKDAQRMADGIERHAAEERRPVSAP